MMRLIDRVRAQVGSIPDDLPVIVADPVAEQIDQLPGDTWSASPPAEVYGCVAPPFKRFWIEAQTAVDLRNVDIQAARNFQAIQRGVMIEVVDSEADGERWRYVFTPFVWYEPIDGAPGRGLDTVNGRIFLNLDKDGRILDDLEAVETAVFDRTEITAAKMRSYVSFLPFVLKALSVLHQRTVVERIRYTRQQQRQHQRQHGKPPADYYLLTVKPSPVADMADVAQPVQPKAVRREHQVRGHFRYYTEERPLFGRYAGMVWIPDHQRGDPDEGSIHKGYFVDGSEQ
ncbi:MAG: hypothetical protein KC419_20075 [Anaerolineales bacterium]|nr:hypothetical protein [Anaerolineales bacterium]